MRIVNVAGATFRIVAEPRDGVWVARASRDGTGEPFGIETTGASDDEASDRLVQWLEWQHEHSQALEALQQAERAYHRTIAGSAFASPTEGPTPIELQKEALEAVERARLRLDDVRARKPD